jgi:hypothetical protein
MVDLQIEGLSRGIRPQDFGGILLGAALVVFGQDCRPVAGIESDDRIAGFSAGIQGSRLKVSMRR